MAIPKKKFEICHSIGELSARLGMPLLNVKAAVLFAVIRTEIMRILSLGDLIADVKSIIILADDYRDTIMKAHKECTMSSLASQGKLPGFKLGESWRFDMDRIQRLFAGVPYVSKDWPDGDHGNTETEER